MLKINWSVLTWVKEEQEKATEQWQQKMPKNDSFFVENVQVRSSIPILNLSYMIIRKFNY